MFSINDNDSDRHDHDDSYHHLLHRLLINTPASSRLMAIVEVRWGV